MWLTWSNTAERSHKAQNKIYFFVMIQNIDFDKSHFNYVV